MFGMKGWCAFFALKPNGIQTIESDCDLPMRFLQQGSMPFHHRRTLRPVLQCVHPLLQLFRTRHLHLLLLPVSFALGIAAGKKKSQSPIAKKMVSKRDIKKLISRRKDNELFYRISCGVNKPRVPIAFAAAPNFQLNKQNDTSPRSLPHRVADAHGML